VEEEAPEPVAAEEEKAVSSTSEEEAKPVVAYEKHKPVLKMIGELEFVE
jgi:hypothetical protein